MLQHSAAPPSHGGPTTDVSEWRNAYPLEPLFPRQLLVDLANRYAEPHRHYHNGKHVTALLSHLTAYRALAKEPDAIAAAILFHDAIYDTKRQDNEALSAELARQALTSLEWPGDGVETVADMILATAHHRSTQNDPDALLFLDLDLSILSASAAEYAAYSAAIRREFDWVAPSAYIAGRRRVLSGFLARESLFKTPELRARWETAARANVVRELSVLETSA